MMQVGYNILTRKPVMIDETKTFHMAIVGGTGSGKTVSVLYMLYKLFKCYEINSEKQIRLVVCDFKKSGDYRGISEEFAEYTEVTKCIEGFYDEFEKTAEENAKLKLLLIDEYAGYITWLMQIDRKKAEEIKQKISSILMMGRSRRCFIWCVQQRISASLFPTGIGAIDNFQICLGLGRLSVESRKSLFAGEHLENKFFEERFHPKTGQGLVLIDGEELQPIQIPFISSVERLKLLLQKMYENRSCLEKK